MASLKDFKTNLKGSSAIGSNNGIAIGAIALEVTSYDAATGEIKGTLHKPNENIEIGTEVTVKSLDKFKDKNMTNIKKGMGGSAGSILMLENCYLNEGNNIVARWITTAISKPKTFDPSSGHSERTVEHLFLESPRLNFTNPNPLPSEPDRINWPINAEKMRFTGKNGEVKTYDRDWFRSKLKAMYESNRFARISALSPDVDSAVQVESTEEAVLLLKDILSEPNAVGLIRINDGSDIEVRRIYVNNVKVGDQYVRDLDGLVSKLSDNGLFTVMDNNTLDTYLKEGWSLEVIPAKELVMIGDTNKLIVKDLIDKPLSALVNYTSRFGTDPNQTSEFYGIIAPTKSGDPSFAGLPVSLSKDRVQSNYIKTRIFDLEPPVKVTTAEESTIEPGGEDFDGDFEIVPIENAEPAKTQPVKKNRF